VILQTPTLPVPNLEILFFFHPFSFFSFFLCTFFLS
jgi:hypothetical protein